MRSTAILFMGLLMAGFLTTNALATNEGKPSQAQDSEWSQEHTSLSAHLAALEAYQAQTTDIKKKIRVHENRLGQLADKPHLDPKGLHRFASKMLFNQLRNEMEKIEQRIAWHHAQIRQLQA